MLNELAKFEESIKKKIDSSKKETQKIDDRIAELKDAQIYSLQMVLAIQRKVQEIETHVGSHAF